MIRVFFLLLVTVFQATAAWPNGYTYRRQIVINHAEVAGPLTAYPLLFAGTYSDLATIANGGKLNSANGYDLIVTSDAAGAKPLNFQCVSWSATTGTVVLMVNVSALSNIRDTTLYLFYGNSSVTTDPQNPSGVWDANYKAVFHLADNAANTLVAESTSNAHNGTNLTITSSKSVAGPFQGGTLGSGLTYDGWTDFTDLGESADWDVGSGDATWEIWISPVILGTYNAFLSHGAYGADGYYIQFSNQNANPGAAALVNGANVTPVSSFNGVLNVGTWTSLVFVKSGVMGTWFSNGVPVGSGYLGALAPSARHLWLGRYDSGGGAPAILSEFRFSSTARSAAWITTTFNNQNSPSGFYTTGPAQQQSAGVTMSSFVIF